ncbi:uncharacterized protein CCOS01_01567 [Colletotrichum costaricense]|uniref:Uncharacterized protein n=2 Tax=Colletotrichum acutatum species complex TaxID=2707335 RepID=A0AAI9ZB51_9PEZI|nr:uncharacterized protein CCOS01_01567 [Colletotrichum costaricense]KAK1540253.1 hypothetical protein CCOS01_01567 [Colletotrichum costaricense]
MRWGTQQLGATKNRQRVTKSSEPISDPAIKISDNRSLPRQASLQVCLQLANEGIRAGDMSRKTSRPVRRRWRVSAGS